MNNFWAVLAGFIVASIVVFGVESIQLTDIERPGMDASMEEVKAYINKLPLISFVKVLLAHALGALIGGWVARWISKSERRIAGWIFGGLFLGVTIINLFAVPHPMWFKVVDLLIILPFCYIGILIGERFKNQKQNQA